MPHRRCRGLEYFSLGTIRARVTEIRVRKIRRTGPPHYGNSIRRPEAQPAPDADRRRRPSRQMVFRTQAGYARREKDRRRIPPSADWAGNSEVEQLAEVIGGVLRTPFLWHRKPRRGT